MMIGKLSFIGAGSMAEAIISGILTKGVMSPENIHVINKSNKDRLLSLKERYHVHCTNDVKQVIKDAKIIILSVKPKDIGDALESIKPYILPNQLVISVVAGVSTDFITKTLECRIPIVRAMPNTSAAIGLSATAIAAGRYATRVELEQAKALFQTIGTVTVVSEEDLHAVTGLSGSGPAYIYYLVEAMEKAAADAGLEKEKAKELIIQTLAGTAEMLKVSDVDASILREKVTSPGGTTQAGLETLQKYHYQEALIACIRQATNRSIELGASYESD
jgi:pyrroline-5-carboxylate reductase